MGEIRFMEILKLDTLPINAHGLLSNCGGKNGKRPAESTI